MIKYNKLKVAFKNERIEDQFRIYRFFSNAKYIKYGALILDLVDSSLSARSVVFEKGNTFYALFDHSISLFALRANMKKVEETQGLEVYEETNNIQSIPQHILLQLLFNSLSNSGNELLQYNNLTGHLYLISPGNLHHWKKANNLIVKIAALRISVSANLELNLDVTTFTSLSLTNRLRFDKKKLHEYAKYEFLASKLSMRRVLPSDKIDKSNVYIIKQEPNKKSTIPFFSFESKETFSKSKLGLLYDFWIYAKSDLGEFVDLQFESISETTSVGLSKKLSEVKSNQISKLLDSNAINIIDTIQDGDSREFLDDLKLALREISPSISIVNNAKINSDILNLRLIHNQEYYTKFEIDDPYKSSTDSIVQHITFEDFSFSAKAAIKNVLKELSIKSDIKNRQISIFDWSNLGFDRSWTFAIKKAEIYYFLTIDPIGKMEFESYQPELLDTHRFDQIMETYEREPRDKIEGFIVSADGHVNFIERSRSFTIPDFETVGNELSMATEPILLHCTEIIDYLERFKRETELTTKHENTIDDYKNRISEIDSILDRKQILSIVEDRTIRKRFSNWFFEKTGKLLHYYFRDQRRYELFNSNLDIKYWVDKSQNHLCYFVGEKGEGIQAKFPKASIIRNIRPSNSSRLFFDQLIPTLNVDFVRNEALTVVPFPFKYLKEYIKSVDESNHTASQA